MPLLPPEPMLATALTGPPVLRDGWSAEMKWDGFRCMLARPRDAPVVMRSRRGTNLAPFFTEITAAAAALPAEVALDGELVAEAEGRIVFERLLARMNRRGAAAQQLATLMPAHYVAFDLLHTSAAGSTLQRPYRERRTMLQELFAAEQLRAPWTLCPATTDPDTAQSWLEWTAVGIEGWVLKRESSRYRPGRQSAWQKYRNAMNCT